MHTYWGDGHPAQAVACPRCGSRPHRPCVSTLGFMPGTSLGIGMNIRGIHKERLDDARQTHAG